MCIALHNESVLNSFAAPFNRAIKNSFPSQFDMATHCRVDSDFLAGLYSSICTFGTSHYPDICIHGTVA